MLRLSRHLDAFAQLAWPERLRWLMRRLASSATGRIESADRELLEQRILPAYAARARRQTILFIGCDRSTRHYPRRFEEMARQRSVFWTLDIDPRKARYGAARHIVAAAQDLSAHVAPGSLDVVICNGVLGFGLNDRPSFEAAMRECLHALRAGGELILGWNNVAAYAPFDPSQVMFELGFERCEQESPLGHWRVETATPTRHTYDAYVRSR